MQNQSVDDIPRIEYTRTEHPMPNYTILLIGMVTLTLVNGWLFSAAVNESSGIAVHAGLVMSVALLLGLMFWTITLPNRYENRLKNRYAHTLRDYSSDQLRDFERIVYEEMKSNEDCQDNPVEIAVIWRILDARREPSAYEK